MNLAVGFPPKLSVWLAPAMLLALTLCGCPSKPASGPAVELATSDLIARINANNASVHNLWSRLDIKVELPGEKYSISGHLILRKPLEKGQPPRDLLLRGSDSLGAAEFQLGSNNQGYWYMLRAPRTEPVYSFVAYDKSEAQAGQASQALDLLSVLGVYELPDKLDQSPWPVCRGYDEPAYYVISFVERTATGPLRVRKDIWWNRRSQHVDLIELFDERGQRYLSAALDDYRRFDGPELATRIRVTWYEQKLVLDLKLNDVQVNSDKVTDKNFQHRKPDWAK